MSRRIRELRKMAEDGGLSVLSVTAGISIKLAVRNAYGYQAIVVAPRTPSDHRAMLNARAHLRRVATYENRPAQPIHSTGKQP